MLYIDLRLQRYDKIFELRSLANIYCGVWRIIVAEFGEVNDVGNFISTY